MGPLEDPDLAATTAPPRRKPFIQCAGTWRHGKSPPPRRQSRFRPCRPRNRGSEEHTCAPCSLVRRASTVSLRTKYVRTKVLNAFLPFSWSVLVNGNITSVSEEKSWVEKLLACTHRISARRSANRNRTQFSMQNQRRRAVSTGGACTYALDWQNHALRFILGDRNDSCFQVGLRARLTRNSMWSRMSERPSVVSVR